MIYEILTDLAGPYLRRHLSLRVQRGKEEANRLSERYGVATAARAPGKLIWFHAASVGEGVALLALINAIITRYPDLHVLVTSGTVTSAEILAKRLPEGAIHQYVPLDRRAWVNAFLNHWQPNAAIWTESEIWPNLLRGLAERNIPAAMVNGRLSARSAKKWKFLSRQLKDLLQIFLIRLAQSEGDAARLSSFGVVFRHVGNLKLAIEPAPMDVVAAQDLRNAIGDRQIWLAASTHPGEEAIAIAVHKRLAVSHRDLLTIVVPRHPARGAEIAMLAEAEGLAFARRSQNALPNAQTQIYIADTMGELGTFYEVISIVFIGGSLTFDGHSPVEAAQRGAAIVYGPEMRNNASIATALEEAGGACRITNAEELATTIEAWLKDTATVRAMAENAKHVVDQGAEVVARIMTELKPLFLAAAFI